jgi:ubiquinone/menaquinone biosynthesis C-methylase UbiE
MDVSRVTRTHEEARESYDRISGWYDGLEGIWERGAVEMGLRTLAAGNGEVVLEIGFGTGHALVSLARSVGPDGCVYGVDLSPRMLALARRRLEAERLAQRVRLFNADALALPIADGSCDAIFMSFVLELFDTPEIPAVLRECARTLRPGGRICVVSLSRAGARSLMRDLYEGAHRRFPRLIDCRPIYAARSLAEAGFQGVDAARATLWGLPVEVAAGRKHE